MKVLVTGGAGFIGSHIAEYFAEEGHTVRILDNLATGYIKNIPQNKNIEFIQGDICDFSLVEKAVSGIDYVFHEAALVSVPLSCERPAEAFRINTLGTLNVLKACVKANVNKFVTASSAAVYGNNPVLPKREDMYPEPASPYAISKLDGEYLARMFYENHGLRTTCLRYFNVYGPRQDPRSPYAAVIPIFLDRAKAGKDLIIYGDGLQSRDFVHVKDVVRANVAALEHGDGQVFNVAMGKSVTILELAENIIKLTGSSSKIVHAAPRAGDVKDSRADVSKISSWWKGEIELQDGLKSLI
ncbi:UDP-glucose 4-epimerase [Methanosarcina thermophila]|mgnify:FL=1|jgi:UDP-glucose 4-epimerase|uniref:UDP-glucose 4-epimerase n=3 Tax=Methanosarcina thermophila TaxID=2210 RepID=A0A1I6X2P6_METTE|nr:SDR family NAD(P)-dependent oxidoreductase [Methanosarcina thermophila]AKB13434.1 UDP-glucose 4-epimerase [Methanosarcina thermophila TM-1]AKB15931.1 UDP-glucose 4-epimerase [Methanosarcina thermophila CHTI-55]NLU57427.1 SDR family NAD(P)-dependent oxidoreductase [Methanosarcina thermophila]SFT32489.1 UDP-glucose 4-epimerase [Methanosarcina thermophila]BAW28438.1 dTDP-glucose 4,6-dehydratase [Methanosarcina thermophila]